MLNVSVDSDEGFFSTSKNLETKIQRRDSLQIWKCGNQALKEEFYAQPEVAPVEICDILSVRENHSAD